MLAVSSSENPMTSTAAAKSGVPRPDAGIAAVKAATIARNVLKTIGREPSSARMHGHGMGSVRCLIFYEPQCLFFL